MNINRGIPSVGWHLWLRLKPESLCLINVAVICSDLNRSWTILLKRCPQFGIFDHLCVVLCGLRLQLTQRLNYLSPSIKVQVIAKVSSTHSSTGNLRLPLPDLEIED